MLDSGSAVGGTTNEHEFRLFTDVRFLRAASGVIYSSNHRFSSESERGRLRISLLAKKWTASHLESDENMRHMECGDAVTALDSSGA
jgi:hypothetical protein